MKILLPIDDSPCSEAALQTVIAQFRPDCSEVHVLHVDEWPTGLPTSLAFAEGPAAADNILCVHEEARRRSRTLMASAAQRLSAAAFRASTEEREGDPPGEILDCAAHWHPDIIVLGSHGRKDFDRWVMGSVAENVMTHATCSVAVVRGSAPLE